MMHIFSYFCDFYSFLQNPADANPHGVEWMPSGSGVWVWKTKKAPKMENRHPSGHPCALSRMHIFPHFSEFLLIFQHGSILTKKRTLVCVCAKFSKNPMWWGWMERTEGGWVQSSPTGPLMDAFDSPARAECDAHFFIFFVIFIHFCKIQRMPTHTVWSGCQWVGCLEVENKKSPKTGTRHQSGRPCAPSRMHIFPHFSEFLLIFHRRLEVDLKSHPGYVCERSFRKNPMQCARMERMASDCVRSGPIHPVMDAFDSPARAECDAHFFIF